MTIYDLLERYILARELAEQSERYYRRMVGVLCSWAGRRVALDDFTPDLVNRMLLDKQRAGLSSHYRRSLRNSMRALLGFHAGGPITGQLRRVQLDELVIEVWTAAEVQRLIDACSYMRDPSRRIWWQTLIAVGYYTGLSNIDLWRLRQRDVGTLGRVAIRRSKTGKLVIVSVPEPWLSRIRQLGGDVIWGRPMSEQVFQATFRLIAAKAGLSGTFKKLRKSCGTSVEMNRPGCGHIILGNGRGIFEKHYLGRKDINENPPGPEPLPPSP